MCFVRQRLGGKNTTDTSLFYLEIVLVRGMFFINQYIPGGITKRIEKQTKLQNDLLTKESHIIRVYFLFLSFSLWDIFSN